LGHETARRLGELDWSVFLGARDEMRGREDAGHLMADVTFVPLDVTSNASVATAVRNVRGYTDRLDVLTTSPGQYRDRDGSLPW
jgi:NADP-dependent 3-hydroxy acid dehydrogenase YdfG